VQWIPLRVALSGPGVHRARNRSRVCIAILRWASRVLTITHLTWHCVVLRQPSDRPTRASLDVTEAVYSLHSSIKRLHEHHMIPTNVCDAHEPPRSTYYGREIDRTTAGGRRPNFCLACWLRRVHARGAKEPTSLSYTFISSLCMAVTIIFALQIFYLTKTYSICQTDILFDTDLLYLTKNFLFDKDLLHLPNRYSVWQRLKLFVKVFFVWHTTKMYELYLATSSFVRHRLLLFDKWLFCLT
jgi:hypothetical protein